MSFRSITKFGSTFCGRHSSIVNLWLSKSTKFQVIAASSAIFTKSGHSNRNVHASANHSHQFRIEGIQGPFPTPLSLKESKRLLKRAAEQSSYGFSQQGVQGFQLHTDYARNGGARRMAQVEDWEMEAACPQGVQGNSDQQVNCGHFLTWLENCRRYGLANCAEQLQGIQTGRLTLAEVLAQQEILIAEVVENYRKHSLQKNNQEDESVQGVQGNHLQLRETSASCPQGVQGEDCDQFKAVQQYQQRRNYSTQTRGDGPESAASKPVAESTGTQLSQREKLKRAVKEYGSTVIVFHVAISLVSLGGFYLAVSRCVLLFLLVHDLLIVLLTNSFFSSEKKKNKKNTQ